MVFLTFENTWPYEKMGDDIYVQECPYCGQENVLTHLTKGNLQRALEEIKTPLIMPCCSTRMVIIQADEDYFWTEDKLRGEGR
ncbi:hypothetical protein [Sinobaca sp. H24]|uniref:hypothetical protein n=1 Tax=Sinobaca sp. H24 TaxID=2923376 RepID=UPI0020799EB4|nr:hypothetical protein [Sinobaca sp. H24]